MTDIIRIDLGGVNCYLAKGGDGFILFDSGGHLVVMDKQFTDRRELLLKKLEAAGVTAKNLNLIVLTHGDNDHVCNAVYLRERFQTKIAMHGGDRSLVENPNLQEWMESFRCRSWMYRVVLKLMKTRITRVTQKTLDDFVPFSPDVLLEDGFDLSAYGLDAKIIHVPGHTNGAIAVLTGGGDLIAGDVFANIKKPGLTPNGNDFKQLFASVDKLRAFEIETVYPGHGNPFLFEAIKGKL